MTDLDRAQLERLGRTYLYPNYRQPEIVMRRGRGSELWDTEGKRYLDMYAGIAVCALGHSHPDIVSALHEQGGRLMHVSNYYFNEPNVQLAQELCQLTGMDRVLFCNSGTEAIEAVLKLSRRHFFAQGETERYQIIAFEKSFHGRTLGALTATGQAAYREGFGPLSGVTHVPYGDSDAVAATLDDRVAGILVEPVQGEGGVIPAPPGFLERLRELCDRSGALLLGDEIQTGVGRTGTFLGFEQSGARPDAIAMAKGLGGGFPIGAMLCRQALAEALPPGSHGTTFGGNPLASAVARAVLGRIQSDDLVAGAARLGAHLASGLQKLATKHGSLVAEQRGVGLLQALVLEPDVDARSIFTKLRDRGLLVTIAGGRALRFSPALTVTQAQLDEALQILDEVLQASV